MSTVIVVTPQLVELETLRAGFAECGYESSHSSEGRIKLWSIPALKVVVAVGGHGKAQFALQTQHLLDTLQDVEGVICVGGSGSLDPRLRIGDIVVGTTTIEHDYRMRFAESPLPEYPGSQKLTTAFRKISEYVQCGGTLWFDRIASGDEDVIDAIRAAELRAVTGAACVAWEGSGGARAAAFSGVPFVEIRGITDSADETARGDYHRNLEIVMPRIASLLVSWRKHCAF